MLVVWGDVEPSLCGPYATDATRLQAARRHRRLGDQHGLYRLDATGRVVIETFSGGELEV